MLGPPGTTRYNAAGLGGQHVVCSPRRSSGAAAGSPSTFLVLTSNFRRDATVAARKVIAYAPNGRLEPGSGAG